MMNSIVELARLRARVATLEEENTQLKAAAPAVAPAEDDWDTSVDEWEESARHWSDEGDWASSTC